MACSGCLDERVAWIPEWKHHAEGCRPCGIAAHWELAGSGYEADSIDILFCPFCGAKLDAEAPENGAVWGVQAFANWVRLEYRVARDRAATEARRQAIAVEEWQRIWSGWTRSRP